MIHSIGSSLPTFKRIEFSEGLNIVLADLTEQSLSTDTRNGAGKSSIIDILHFLLGGNADPSSIFRQEPLTQHSFSLRLDFRGEVLEVARTGDAPGRVRLTREDSGEEEQISNEEWKRRLGQELFGLSYTESYSPSVRSCLSYFMRRQAGGGFHVPTKHFNQQPTWDVQENLSVLLGLNVELAREWQQTRLRERELQTLRKAAEGGTLGEVVGNSAELSSALAVAQAELNELSAGISDFTVVPQYRTVEAEVTRAGSAVRRLNNEIISDRDYLVQLERAMADIPTVEPSTSIAELFQAASVQLPEVTLQAFDEVQAFHQSVIANRRDYLRSEYDTVSARLRLAEQERDRISDGRQEGLRLLNSGGALETLFEMQRDLTGRQVRLESLRERYDIAIALESQKGELDVQRATLEASLRRDLIERQPTLTPAYVLYERISHSLYAQDWRGQLSVAATSNGPEITATIPSQPGAERSKGIQSMQIFCFDLMLATLWARAGSGPGFLVHDSHLFDGVDERQVAAALLAGVEYSVSEGFQYIVTINSDQLPKLLPDERPTEDFVLPVRLTDAAGGGLFGIRF